MIFSFTVNVCGETGLGQSCGTIFCEPSIKGLRPHYACIGSQLAVYSSGYNNEL